MFNQRPVKCHLQKYSGEIHPFSYTGERKPVSRDTWDGPDDHLNDMRW